MGSIVYQGNLNIALVEVLTDLLKELIQDVTRSHLCMLLEMWWLGGQGSLT